MLQHAAQIQVQSFLHRIENRIETDHHDMGFPLFALLHRRMTGG